MSTHTIYGCYNKTTGVIEFADTESGCDGATITGCYVSTGDHAGEIKITHDYENCETQYYACYDPETGKFKAEIDDGCCIESVPGTCCGTDCSSIPKYVRITLSGIANCGSNPSQGGYNSRPSYGCTYTCETCSDLNGTYIAEASGCKYTWTGDCWWCPVPNTGEATVRTVRFDLNSSTSTNVTGTAYIASPTFSHCFSGSDTVDNTSDCNRCGQTYVLTNNEECNGSDYYFHGNGGTMTVVVP